MDSSEHLYETDPYRLDDLRQLRADGLFYLVGVQYFCSLVLIIVPLPFRVGQSAGFGLGFIVAALLAFGLRFARPRLAALLVLASWFGLWAIMLSLLPADAVAVLAVLVVGVASALFGPQAAFLTAILISATLLRAHANGLLSLEAMLSSALIVWVGAVLFWLTARPITTFLGWAWSSYVDARETRDQLRQRQGELNRALKSLEIAYSRLEHLNDELNRARHVAEEAQRFKSQFAASISHELRTPLNLIIGFSEMMVAMPHTYGTTPLPATYQADIAAIYHNARHLAGLIDDVLDLAQIEAGRMGLAREWTNVGDIAEEAARAMARRLEALGLHLELSIRPGLPPVFVDRTRIRQILINLLNNAARFTDQGGIWITIERQGNDVVVSVADSGVGIPAEDLPHVFDEFFQASSSLQRRVGGSGLGLTISKKLVELHGGAMWAESTPGAGSTFRFSLPLSTNIATGVLPGEWTIWDHVSHDHEPAKPALAVVAEDEEILRSFQRHLDGYRIVPATPEMLTHGPGDDLPLHGAIIATPNPATFWKTLSEACDHGHALPIAVATVPGEHSQALELGITDSLTKPISREKVAQLLARLGKKVRTVLVVDDNREMVRLLARMIHGSGRRYRVLQATGGAEALQIMSEQHPDVILLDLIMPEVDGYAVLAAMRSREDLKDVPVIAISAGSSLIETRTVSLLGITRPGGLSTDELMGCVKSCFDVLRWAPSARSEPAPTAGCPESPA